MPNLLHCINQGMSFIKPELSTGTWVAPPLPQFAKNCDIHKFHTSWWTCTNFSLLASSLNSNNIIVVFANIYDDFMAQQVIGVFSVGHCLPFMILMCVSV